MASSRVRCTRAIAILTYHSIDQSGSVLSTSPQHFAEQMRILDELPVKVIPLEELAHVLADTSVVENLVAITFDDGFRTVYKHGAPVLQRYGFPATVFLVTDYCGRSNSWPGQPAHIIRRELLCWSEIQEMCEAGFRFGSHTANHPNLTTLSDSDVEQELFTSKRQIEDATGLPANTMAYPYGEYNETVKQLAQAHFSLACSSTLGFVRPRSDLFTLARLDMYYLRRPRALRRLFTRPMGAYILGRRIMRRLRARVPGLPRYT